MRKVVVVGNCQAQFLEGVFSMAGGGYVSVDRLPPNFTLTAAEQANVESRLDAADVIFIQRTAEEYQLEWLRSRAVAEKYLGKTWVWPNLYFDGYFPNTRYIYLQSGKLQGPLDDYHLTPILQSWKQGEDTAQALKRLQEDSCGTPEPFDASLKNLREREADCTVRMADFVEQEVYKKKCFYTPNHPHTYLLIELGRRLAAAADIRFELETAKSWKYHLDKIDLPVFGWIAHKYSLNFAASPLYKGLSIKLGEGAKAELGDTQMYEPELLVQKFYSVYRSAL